MKSFYPKGNWVKWKSRIEESVESLIKWAFEKTVNKSWQNRWETKQNFQANEIKFMTGSESPVNTMLTSDYKVFRAFFSRLYVKFCAILLY